MKHKREAYLKFKNGDKLRIPYKYIDRFLKPIEKYHEVTLEESVEISLDMCNEHIGTLYISRDKSEKRETRTNKG